jgi:transposase
VDLVGKRSQIELQMSHSKYDDAFKRNAVKLVESGTTAAQVARDLGIPVNQLYMWCSRYRKTPSKHGNASENQDEVKKLQKELTRTRMELDILKKAITIFSRSELSSVDSTTDPLLRRR